MAPAGKTKILYLITKSNWGGAQKYVFDLATNLPVDTFKITVAGGGTGQKGAPVGELFRLLQQKGVKTISVPSFTRDVFLLNEPLAFFDVCKILFKEKPDVLHVNSSKAAGIGVFCGRLLRVRKIVYTVHGWPFNEEHSALIKNILYFFSWLTGLLAHEVIVVNKMDYQQGQRMPLVAKKMTFIYNGLSPISFFSRSQAREKLESIIKQSFPPSQLLLGTIAELHSNKGLRYLIEAIAQIPDWKLIIIGEGEERPFLAELINNLGLTDRVFLAGFVAGAATLLKGFDSFALVSLKEGLPYSVLEAGQAELPVIGSDIPGIETIIGDEKGFLVPVKNSEAIAKVLRFITLNKPLRDTATHNLHTYVQSEFSIDKMIDNIISVYWE